MYIPNRSHTVHVASNFSRHRRPSGRVRYLLLRVIRVSLTVLRSRFLNNICYAATGESPPVFVMMAHDVLTLSFSALLLRLLSNVGPRSRPHLEGQAQPGICALLRAQVLGFVGHCSRYAGLSFLAELADYTRALFSLSLEPSVTDMFNRGELAITPSR